MSASAAQGKLCVSCRVSLATSSKKGADGKLRPYCEACKTRKRPVLKISPERRELERERKAHANMGINPRERYIDEKHG